MRSRTLARSAWRTLLFLSVLVGVGGGVALAAVAGARRSADVLPRFLAHSAGPDVGVVVAPPGRQVVFGPGDDQSAVRSDLAALPEVERAARGASALLGVPDPVSPSGWRTVLGVAAIDSSVVETVGQPILVQGRLPQSDRADEVAINEEMADRHDLTVGAQLSLGAYGRDQFAGVGNGQTMAPSGRIAPVHVTGIVRYPSDLLPTRLDRSELSNDHSTVYLTPRWWAAGAPDIATYGVGVAVWLGDGQMAAFRRDLDRLYGGRAVVLDGSTIGYEFAPGLPGVRRAIDIERFALLMFGGLAALATLLLFSQSLLRRALAD